MQWPARGFQLLLAGETAEGRPVAGVLLTFGAVANRYELREFLNGRRRFERKGGCTRNTIAPYPLRLPARLTYLRPSRMRRASHGDAAFTDAHGKPPTAGPKRRLYLFALAEKRFRGRNPFPILCERLSLADAKGGLLSGAEAPPPRHWSTDQYRRLGMRFLEAVVMDERAAAWNLTVQGVPQAARQGRMGPPPRRVPGLRPTIRATA